MGGGGGGGAACIPGDCRAIDLRIRGFCFRTAIVRLSLSCACHSASLVSSEVRALPDQKLFMYAIGVVIIGDRCTERDVDLANAFVENGIEEYSDFF